MSDLMDSGRGFSCDTSEGRWYIIGPVQIEIHPRWWKLGVSVSRRMFGLYLGPLVVGIGKPLVRDLPSPLWNPWMANTTSGSTYTITTSSGGSAAHEI